MNTCIKYTTIPSCYPFHNYLQLLGLGQNLCLINPFTIEALLKVVIERKSSKDNYRSTERWVINVNYLATLMKTVNDFLN